MQFQVPQFIETEDKVVGPLTLRQFLYVAVAAGISFVCFFFLQTWAWFVITLAVLLAAAALAFAKVEGRPFGNVFISALSFYWNPQTYVWQPEKKFTAHTEMRHEETSSVERIVQGISLKKAWRSVQTGSSAERKPDTKTVVSTERYEVFRGRTGENRAAKRVDYR